MKKLNKYQKLILLIAFIIFLLINSFPPWRAVANPPEYTVTQSIGYAPFFNPPNSPLGFESYVIINYGRLFLEWAGLVVLTGAAILFTGKK